MGIGSIFGFGRRAGAVADPAATPHAGTVRHALGAAGPAAPPAGHPAASAASALLLPSRTIDEVLQGERLLSTGHMPRSPERALDLGINGQLGVYRVADRTSGASMEALVKPVSKGGAHEVFGYEVARALGIEHLFAITGRRGNGAAAIEFLSGSRTISAAGLDDPVALEAALAAGYRSRVPGMGADEAAHRARIDRQLFQVYDLVIGNRDRHGRNAMFDAASGRLTLIDHGKMASFKKDLVKYNSSFAFGPDTASVGAGGARELRLDPEVRQLLAGADRDRIQRAFRQLSRDVRVAPSIGHNGVRPDATWLPRMFGTIDAVVDAGSVRYIGGPPL